MEKETPHQRRHDSLHCPRVKCNFDRSERHSGKTKQITNWSVSSFKGSLSFSVLKLLNMKLELSIEKLK